MKLIGYFLLRLLQTITILPMMISWCLWVALSLFVIGIVYLFTGKSLDWIELIEGYHGFIGKYWCRTWP